ncbi:MAG: sodium-dependent transporter [Clostridia bacterium]|nr:sodium-dependent transporter [Clostridia bacterium]
MQKREKFSSRLGFILISAGCAIGLGNVYRFPIITGAYGGAFFVLIYLVFLVLLGIPVMTAELAVGRGSQRSIATSFDALERKGQKWHLMKYVGIAGNYLLMMFYTAICSWLVVYLFKYIDGSMLQHTTAEALGGVFGSITANPGLQVGVAFAVILACFGICSMGLQKGVEKITKIMMVMLLVLIIVLAVYSCTLPGAAAGLKFYLVPSISNLLNSGVWTTVSAAMGQAFFTLSLGIGAIAIFGSYIDKDRSLLGEAMTITSLDTFVALCSGFIVFPAYFTFNPTATGISADQAGAGFLFTTLSSIFNNMAAGRVIGSLFFLFMLFAALSTVIAVFENIIAFWLELTKLKRRTIAVINVLLVMALSLPAIFSSNLWKDVIIFGKNFMDLEDYIVSNLLLPLGSLGYVLFVTTRYGWGWGKFESEVNAGNGLRMPRWFKPYMTYVLPIVIVIVLVMAAF